MNIKVNIPKPGDNLPFIVLIAPNDGNPYTYYYHTDGILRVTSAFLLNKTQYEPDADAKCDTNLAVALGISLTVPVKQIVC